MQMAESEPQKRQKLSHSASVSNMASSLGISDLYSVPEAFKEEEEKRPAMEHAEAPKRISISKEKAEQLL